MAERLSAERIAKIRGTYLASQAVCELLVHIDAIEAELQHTIAAWHDSENQRAEARDLVRRLVIGGATDTELVDAGRAIERWRKEG